MLHMPRRSVTRFFIPLIDVLILLFGMFLLLPFVKEEDGTSIARMEEQIRVLERQLDQRKGLDEEARAQRQQELEGLRKEKIKALQDRLVFRVLEVDGQTGKLYYYDPRKLEIRDEADALRLIDYDKQERSGGQRELYYLILYPRDRDSDHPTWEERRLFERWFQGVALGFDVPRTARQERKP